MSGSTKAAFVYRGVEKEELAGASAYILSPEYYYIKPVDMQISDRKLLRIAPSIFEEFGDEDLRYGVLKSAQRRYVVAYSPQRIAELFKQLGLEPPSHIHLAQKELEAFEGCVALPNGGCLVPIEGVWFWIVCDGRKCVAAQEFLASHTPSSFRLPLATKALEHQERLTLYLALAALLLIAGLVISYYDIRTKTRGFEEMVDAKIEAMGLPKTLVQLRSIEGELSSGREANEAVAKLFEALQHAPWGSVKVKRIVVAKKSATIELLSPPPAGLLEYLQARFENVRSAKNRVEVEL